MTLFTIQLNGKEITGYTLEKIFKVRADPTLRIVGEYKSLTYEQLKLTKLRDKIIALEEREAQAKIAKEKLRSAAHVNNQNSPTTAPTTSDSNVISSTP